MKHSNLKLAKSNDTVSSETHLRHFCHITSQELSKVLGIIIGELEYGQKAGEKNSHKIALSAAEKALHLAQNLRYFVVGTRLNLHRHDLSQLLLDTIDGIEEDFKKRKITFTVQVEENALVDIDAVAIQHVLLNLLWNAAHTMPQGGKSTISLFINNKSVEICLTDTGVGISPDRIEKLFEPYQPINPEDEYSENYGLGLSVARTLIESHGGHIEVRSQIGRGNQYIITLPYDPKSGQIQSHTEKRRFRRVHLILPAELGLQSGRRFLTFVTVLSNGGCFVSLQSVDPKDFPEKDSLVSLKISHHEGAELEITEARVASVIREEGTLGIGLEFNQVTEKAKYLLRALVRSHLP